MDSYGEDPAGYDSNTASRSAAQHYGTRSHKSAPLFDANEKVAPFSSPTPSAASLKIKLKVNNNTVASATGLTASGSTIAPPDVKHEAFQPPPPLAPPTKKGRPPSTPTPPRRSRSASATQTPPTYPQQSQRPTVPPSPPAAARPPSNKAGRPSKVKEEPFPPSVAPSESSLDDTDAAEAPSKAGSAKAKQKTRAKRNTNKKQNLSEIDPDDIDDSYIDKDAIAFWKQIEEIRAPFKAEDVALCTMDGASLPPQHPLMQVPNLGPHFRVAWHQEDEKEIRDMSSQADYGSRAAARLAARQAREKEDRAAKDKAEDEAKVGDFTSRLMSSLLQDTIVVSSFFTRALAESEFNGEESTSGRLQGHGFADANNFADLDIKIKRELKDLGLFMELPADVRKGPQTASEKEDEIVTKIKELQQELLYVRKEATKRREQLLPLIQAKMKEQEAEKDRWAIFKAREDAAKAQYKEYKKRKRAEKKEEPRKKPRPGSKGPPIPQREKQEEPEELAEDKGDVEFDDDRGGADDVVVSGEADEHEQDQEALMDEEGLELQGAQPTQQLDDGAYPGDQDPMDLDNNGDAMEM